MGYRTEYMRAYYDEHAEERKAYQREYYRRNKDKICARAVAWRKEHPLEASDISRKYYIKHAETRRAHQREYVRRKKGVMAE